MKYLLSSLLSVLLSTVFLVSCKEKKEPTQAIIPEVNIVAVGQQTVPVYTEYVGETHGQDDIQIQSRVDGWITSMNFKEGDLVQKDQLLYTIDDLPLKNKIDQAIANLEVANTTKVKNKAELDRVEPLTAMHALSQRDLDAAKAAYQASVSQVDAAQAALRNAKIELDYTHIKAPITGIIGISKLGVGDFIGRLNTGAPLNTISSINNIRVRFSISEDEYLNFAKRKNNSDHNIVQERIPVQLLLSDGTSYEENGTISLTDRQIDPATGSLLIEAVFTNTKHILRPGQYVKVRVQTDLFKDAVLIPQQAVNQLQNIYQVFAVNDSNKIKPVIIVPGQRIGSNWIVTKGLKAGDKIAIIGSAVVRPNVPIKPTMISWNYDSTSKQ